MDEKVKVIPYIHVDGVPTFKDSDILGLWDRMAEDKTVDYIFQDGSLKTREEFLQAMKGPDIFLILIYYKEELSAIQWVNRFQGNFAQNHFCCFSNIWGKTSVIQACGRVSCLYLLDNLGFDMLLGMIPEYNKPAIQAVLAAGAKRVGILPYGSYNHITKKSGPTVVVSYTKDGGKDEDL